MKREIAAGAVLLLLAIGSWINLNYLKGFTGGLEEQLELSRAFCDSGRFVLAEDVLAQAADEWLGADGYTHIFIRHPEIDSTTDAFFELMSDVRAGDAESASGGYEKLAAHLNSLYTMERVTLGSIF